MTTVQFYDKDQVDAKIIPMTHETWTFTLDDDTTVTKDVMLYDGSRSCRSIGRRSRA